MEWGSIIGAGISLLGGGGGGGNDFPHSEGIYARIAANWDEAMRRYHQANLEQADAIAKGNYAANIKRNAAEVLGNMRGARLSAGLDPNRGDSEVARQEALIAGKAGTDIANFGANLDTTREARYAALLPNPQGLTGAAGIGGQMDASANEARANSAASWGLFGQAIIDSIPSKWWGGRSAGGNGTSGPGMPNMFPQTLGYTGSSGGSNNWFKGYGVIPGVKTG